MWFFCFDKERSSTHHHESQLSISPCIGTKALASSPEEVVPIATEVINFSRPRDLTHWDLKEFLSRNGSRIWSYSLKFSPKINPQGKCHLWLWFIWSSKWGKAFFFFFQHKILRTPFWKVTKTSTHQKNPQALLAKLPLWEKRLETEKYELFPLLEESLLALLESDETCQFLTRQKSTDTWKHCRTSPKVSYTHLTLKLKCGF